MVDLEFFAVRNREGKWFRAKGYGGSGLTWVDDIKKARIYQKLGGARAIVSYFANQHPTYGIPVIVKMTVTAVEEIDETVRVEKQRLKKREAEAKARERQAKWELERAKQDYENAKRRIDRLQGGD